MLVKTLSEHIELWPLWDETDGNSMVSRASTWTSCRSSRRSRVRCFCFSCESNDAELRDCTKQECSPRPRKTASRATLMNLRDPEAPRRGQVLLAGRSLRFVWTQDLGKLHSIRLVFPMLMFILVFRIVFRVYCILRTML